MRIAVVLLLCGTVLGGCGTPIRNARLEYEQSAAAYKDCLVQNSSSIRACDGQKAIMELDERKYATITASVDGRSSQITVRQ